MKIMKKLTSLLLTASMLSMMAIPSIVSADDGEFTVAADYTFNGLSKLPGSEVYYSNSSYKENHGLDTTTYADDVLHKDAVYADDSAGATGVRYKYPTGVAASADTPNLYVETEFDVITNMVAGDSATKNRLYISFNNIDSEGSASAVKTMYMETYEKSNYGIWTQSPSNDGTKLSELGTPTTDWHRYRFVMQLTDENGEAVNKVTQIYVDDVDVTAELDETSTALDFSTTDYVNYQQLILRFYSTGDKGNMFWMDNFSVRSYTSENGTSPVPLKMALGNDVVALYSQLEENKNAIDEIDATKYDAIKADIDALLAVYEDAEATRAQVTAAETEVDVISAEIEAAAKKDFYVKAVSKFDDLTNVTAGDENAEDAMSLDTTTYADDVLYGNAVKVIGSSSITNEDGSTTKISNQVIYTFDEAIEASGNNYYIETEYDVKLTNNANHTVYLDGALGTPIFVEKSTGKLYHGYNNSGTYLGQSDSLMNGDWTRLKFVMHLTDAEGAAVNKLVDIFANGTSIMEDDVTADLKSTVSYTKFYLKMSSGAGRTFWLDNLKVTQYNLANAEDASPVPEKYSLGQSIAALYTKLEYNSQNIQQGKYDEIEASIDSLLEVYENAEATQEDVTAAEATAASLSTEIDNSIIISDFRVAAAYNFNDSAEFPDGVSADAGNASGSTKVDINTFADNFMYKNVANIVSSSSQTERLNFVFDESVEGSGNNCYVETEFDIRTEIQFTIFFGYFDDANAMKNLLTPFYTKADGNMYAGYGSSGDVVATVENGLKGWTHLKYKMQLTDENGDAVNKLTGIYANGVNILSAPIEFTATDKSYDFLYLYTGKTASKNLYIDNIAVRKYNLENAEDASPVPDTIALAEAIEKLLAKFKEAGAGLTNQEYASYTASIERYLELYEDVYASASDVEAAVEEANELRIQLIDFDSSVCINSVTFEDSTGAEADSLTNGGKITGVNITKLAEYNENGVVVVTVYNSNGKLEGIDIVTGTILSDLSVDESKDITVDLALPADVTGCTVKAMVVDSIKTLWPLSDPYVPAA